MKKKRQKKEEKKKKKKKKKKKERKKKRKKKKKQKAKNKKKNKKEKRRKKKKENKKKRKKRKQKAKKKKQRIFIQLFLFKNSMEFDGEPIEFEWNILRKIQEILQHRNIDPEKFEDRIIFMSMFNDIDWNKRKYVRGVSWSEVATVPKRKSHRGLDLNLSWNFEEDIWKGRKKSNGTK